MTKERLQPGDRVEIQHWASIASNFHGAQGTVVRRVKPYGVWVQFDQLIAGTSGMWLFERFLTKVTPPVPAGAHVLPDRPDRNEKKWRWK